MNRRDINRPAATLLASFAALSVAVGLAACGSSDASGVTAVPSPSAATIVPVSEPAPTSTAAAATPTTVVVATTPTSTSPAVPPATEAAPTTTDNIAVVTDAEVADLEKQLDEIDQLIAGVDADLSQD